MGEMDPPLTGLTHLTHDMIQSHTTPPPFSDVGISPLIQTDDDICKPRITQIIVVVATVHKTGEFIAADSSSNIEITGDRL
jgi:hypothetical protein